VIMAGNNKSNIYADEYQRNLLLNDLKTYEAKKILYPISWCVMSNHVHIVVKSDFCDLVDSFHRMNTKFAKRQHLRLKTSGRVFQAPFWSEPIETDDYLVRAIRYVHNNPVKAGLVSNAAEWPWSSYLDFRADDLSNEKQFAYQMIGGSWHHFTRFHGDRDLGFRPYDTSDDRRMLRDLFTTDIMDDICRRYKILEWNGVNISKNAVREAVICLREEKDFPQREIASRLGIPLGRVSRIITLYDGP